MRVYQEKWCVDLCEAIKRDDVHGIEEIAWEIIRDDTGNTDELAMLLAKCIRAISDYHRSLS